MLVATQLPPNGLSADAGLNLVNAIRVAASPAARGLGVLTLLNDEIQAAREVTKASTYRLETLRAHDLGMLGYADPDGRVSVYRAPTRRHVPDTEFEVRGRAVLDEGNCESRRGSGATCRDSWGDVSRGSGLPPHHVALQRPAFSTTMGSVVGWTNPVCRPAVKPIREDEVTERESSARAEQSGRSGRVDRRTFLRFLSLAGGVALASACAPTGGPPQGTSGQKPSAPAAAPTPAPAATSAPAAKPAEKPAAEAKPAASPQAAPGAATKVSEIVIGLVHPLSGAVAYEGNLVNNGCLFRLEEANEAGGIKSMGGAKFRPIVADSQAKPEVGQAETERLIREGAVAILGAFQSAVTFVTTQVAEREKIPHVVSVSVADDITKRGFQYTWRQQPNSETMAKLGIASVADLVKSAGGTNNKVVIVHEDTLQGVTMGKYMQEAIQAGGGALNVLDVLPYKATASDFTTEASRVKSLNADVFLINGYYGDTVLWMKALRDLRIDFKAIVGLPNPALSNPKFVQDEPKLAELMMDTNYWWDPKSDRARQVREAWQRKYNEPMTNHSVTAYTSADVLVDALERAGSTDREKLREAISKTKLTNIIMPGGSVEFNERGENINAQPLLLQILKGDITPIGPERYAAAKPVFPIPPVAERTA